MDEKQLHNIDFLSLMIDIEGNLYHNSLEDTELCIQIIKDLNIVEQVAKINVKQIVKGYLIRCSKVNVFNHVLYLVIIEKVNHVFNIDHLAFIDSYTGLYNRNLCEQLKSEQLGISHASAYAVVMIDMDNLKKVNDTYGHNTGDRAIKIIASAILASIDYIEIAMRYGGDEFLIIAPGKNEEQAQMLIEVIREEISRERKQQKFKHRIDISAGIACTNNISRLTSIIRHADCAMYINKKSRKGNIGFI